MAISLQRLREINVEIDRIALEIKEYLDEREDVILAFIFGSAVEGKLTEESDIDIAVLFAHKPSSSGLLDIIDNLSTITGREVDIVILNNSSPIIRMQVLKKGTLLKKKSDAIYNEFFVRTVKEYDDLKYIRKEEEENILRGRIYA
ncbi:nucleotidyltransferase domain protein [bacterium BMS3Bbin06]|nr:nucleotidyltransferase domain protein [bacterium BMS3Abin08]GBE35612.1 nucleotidyltransferase domain protein [bacterium BMS3Bbin06]HDY71376.1 nucleotidyltransferase domain-containing protein [Nitrospirota bacterium]